jgi:hypothetical protein
LLPNGNILSSLDQLAKRFFREEKTTELILMKKTSLKTVSIC